MSAQMTASPLWWESAAAGVIAILFGIAAIAWPHITLGVLVILFGAFVFIEGIVHLIAMFRAIGAHTTWWPQLLLGIISIAAGLFVIAYPGISTVLFVYVVAFWALFVGLIACVSGLFAGSLGVVIGGVVAIVLGLLLLQNPVAGALAYVVVIGIFAMVRGVLLLISAVVAPAPAV